MAGSPQDGRRVPSGSRRRVSKIRRQARERTGDWANGENPFRFQRWYSGKLPIGGEDDFKVFVGHPGVGKSTFWSFQEHVLPDSEGVKATLIYRDSQDEERRAICLLKERC